MSPRALLVLPLLFAVPAAAAGPTPAAPVSALVSKVDIPHQAFTLPNGLRVIVHTDRKAPVVAVQVWYGVGSKHEPRGKTGFAHLFEHLMFGGSENVSNFDTEVIGIGGSENNGTTWFDRTNYYETVPTGALDRMLFIESDRMGYLLGTVTQEKLDQQRGVVQNEKRQGDNQPFGTSSYYVYSTLFGNGHPYGHEAIGSMADLNAASLADVKSWFRANYGPDNAVLVLAGDVDVATARALATKHFGGIPRGTPVGRVVAPVPTLPAPVATVIRDRVPYTRVARYWPVEGTNGRDTTALEVAASVLGGLSSSRLDNLLVRGEQTAVSVTAGVEAYQQVGILSVSADVKPGGDAAAVGRRLDAIVADFLAKGPTADEVQRVVARAVSGTIGGFESVGGSGGKAAALAEGAMISNDPARYKRELVELAAVTPAQVQAAARKWLSRPAFSMTVEPGPRDTSPAALAITGDLPGPAPVAARPETNAATATKRTVPALGQFPPLDFPAIERTKLANGIPVYFARRTGVPAVRVAVSFDAGAAADPVTAGGLQTLTMALLDEGTTSLNSTQIAEAQERLGAGLSSSGGIDRSQIGLYALTANLAPSLDLLADVVRNPAFDPREFERVRAQQLAGIEASLSQPQGVANAILPAKLYGTAYPYGRSFSGLGTPNSVAGLTRDAVVAFRQAWLRPDNAAIFVVGDTTLAELRPLLDARFGTWTAPAGPKPVKDFSAPIPQPAATRIYLADRPGAPQSVIAAGQVLANTGRDDALIVLRQANDVLGGSFLSRLNADLREAKGWSYGVGSSVRRFEQRVPYVITAPVQTDRTGDSIKALIANVRDYVGAKGTTPAELARTNDGSIRELPGQFETSDAVLAAMMQIVTLGRPDDFYERLGDRYQRMTAADLDRAARAAIDPGRLAIVVVGDAAKIRPQLAGLGLPVEDVTPPTK